MQYANIIRIFVFKSAHNDLRFKTHKFNLYLLKQIIFTDMSIKIINISFSRLKKQELKTLASRVIAIGQKHNPQTLKINELFDQLVALQPKIDSLDLGYIAHPISKPLKVLRKQRAAYAQGIIDRMKFIENAMVSGMEKSLKVAKPIVKQHLQNLWKYDDVKVYQNINSFFKVLAENAKLQTAMDTLEMTSYLDNLQSLNQTIEKQYSERREDLSKREKGVTVKTVAAIKIALEYFFKEIEVAAFKNQGLDYKPLIDELNKEIADIKAKLKTRTSNNKNKVVEVLNNKVIVVDKESENPSESTQSIKRMYPLNVEVEDRIDENADQSDIKKKVVLSTIQTHGSINH